jgi:hypothetical protein
MLMFGLILLAGLIGGVVGWEARHLRFAETEAIIRRGDKLSKEADELLAKSQFDQFASEALVNRTILELLEENHTDVVKQILASSIADFYRRWTSPSENQNVPERIKTELTAINKDAVRLPSLRLELEKLNDSKT